MKEENVKWKYQKQCKIDISTLKDFSESSNSYVIFSFVSFSIQSKFIQ